MEKPERRLLSKFLVADDFKSLISIAFGLILAWALCTQFAFLIVQDQQAHQAISTLEAQFRVSLGQTADFSLLAKEIQDLERLKIIRCSQLIYKGVQPATIIDTSFRHKCEDSLASLGGQRIDIDLRTINGTEFHLESITVNQPSFYIALWLMRLLGWAIIGLLVVFFRTRNRHKENLLKMRLETADALNRISAQVSHDIRSPLSALNLLVSRLEGLPEDQRTIIRTATRRINDIANHLLQRSRAGGVNPKAGEKSAAAAVVATAVKPTVMLSGLVDSLVSEKRSQYRERVDVEITADFAQGYGAFVEGSRTELARAISNLIDNSLDAISTWGQVTVSLYADAKCAQIRIQDSGCGIPPEILSKLGERGVTFGKTGGSGLGVYHAKKVVEGNGGRFEVQSRQGVGTLVTLEFPRATSPNWFSEQLLVAKAKRVVSFDDDQSVHSVWRERFQSTEVEHLAFTELAGFEQWFKENGQPADTLYLFDYELIGQSYTGLDLIKRFGLSDNSVLVTSYFEEAEVCAQAVKLGIKILPKSLVHFVRFEMAI